VVGTTVDHIVKSVLFLASPPGAAAPGGIPPDVLAVLVVARGTQRVDYSRVANHLGLSRKRVKLAGPEAVQAITGYPVGAVPPFGHPQPLRTLVDRRVLDVAEVYAGGGSPDALLHITPQAILRATQAEVVDVVESN
jgi:prolyl-tRNA editing enzyme YbaK/EbsC (Cys-tRNA(Pro) deacylase)